MCCAASNRNFVCKTVKYLLEAFYNGGATMEQHNKNGESKKRRKSDLPAFEIDDRITIRIEFELAHQLGNLILDSDVENTAILAIGHQLKNATNNI